MPITRSQSQAAESEVVPEDATAVCQTGERLDETASDKESFESRMVELRRKLEEQKARHFEELQLCKELHDLQMKCEREKYELQLRFERERNELKLEMCNNVHPENIEGKECQMEKPVANSSAIENAETKMHSDELFFTVRENNVKTHTSTMKQMVDGPGQYVQGLTTEQKQARKTICTALPKFAGEPEVWPIFISNFKITTEACGFTNLENLRRLQTCLHGDALEAVRGSLLHPDSVPSTIEDLKNLFGRPGKLLKSLLKKVRETQTPTEENLETFISFGIKVKQLCDHIGVSELDEHMHNPLLVEELVEKLPKSYQIKWVQFKRLQIDGSLRTFSNFMATLVEDISEVVERYGRDEEAKKPSIEKKRMHVHNVEPTQRVPSKNCWVCGRNDHFLRNCHDFSSMPLDEKLYTVRNLNLCENCLARNCHGRCGARSRCEVNGCSGWHNTLLHRADEAMHIGEVINQSATCSTYSPVVFRMQPVTLYNGDSKLDTMAFIDEGSSATLVDSSIATRLNASGVPEPLIISWTNDINRVENESCQLQLRISEKGSPVRFNLVNVRTVSELQLPMSSLKVADLKSKYPHLRDVPAQEYCSSQPMMIIGLDNVHLFAPLESRIGNEGEPIAIRSKLGWTVFGADKRSGMCQTYLNLHNVSEITNQQLYDLIKQQYTLEDSENVADTEMETPEEKRAMRILETTTRRVGDRYETGLLWRKDVQSFPDSLPMAKKRMLALERKMAKQPVLKERVSRLIEEYQEKGYAHKLEPEEMSTMSTNVWYLPLSVVQHPKKPEKTRMVWDAAASVDGVSLNSELLKGPDMLVPLPKVVSHFREKPIAFGGDIQEMYHQLKIRSSDKQAQRFLFGFDESGQPQTYVMDVATFGATCSPSSAQFVKNANAREFEKDYPQAANAIVNYHYVDDYFDSVDTIEEAIRLAEQVKYVHSRGGFFIRNWVSNSAEVLNALENCSEEHQVSIKLENTAYDRVLGITWRAKEDVFCFGSEEHEILQLVELEPIRPTKRKVTSFVMAQFDPLGFFTPITVRGRMLIQDLWRTGCNWDDPIEDDCYAKWLQMIKTMKNLGTVSIPRSYFGTAKSSEVKNCQLHIFTDAGELAYGAVAYFRAIVNGNIKCALVTSRVKVAPFKKISIPRLELLGAVLGARLGKATVSNHELKVESITYWTDSKVVLSWIRSDHRRYKQFVGFRIGEIHSLSNVDNWKWVPTKNNIADLLTKWSKDLDLCSDCAWIQGPRFLYEDENNWPSTETTPANTTEELRMSLLLHHVYSPRLNIDVTRFSRWTVLVRTIACVYRFASNCFERRRGGPAKTLKATAKQHDKIIPNIIPTVRVPLQQEEYEKAEKLLIRKAQQEGFLDEYKVLRNNIELPRDEWMSLERSSPLYRLSPFMDQNGIIRMEGRTEHAEFIPFDLRFPIILPNTHYVTWLVAKNYHEKCGHGYRQAVKNELRQLYYIPHVDSLVRKVASACMWCKVKRNRAQTPRMAPLPIQRLTPNMRPFSFTGVDFLGPFDVTVGRRSEKRWIMLFTCMVIRAVHLEVAHGLSTNSCLMAIRRFVGRRGWPIEFFSDNGTNFQGACKEVTKTVGEIREECADQFSSARTKWTFNPPATPHMGGVWERLVRSVKEALTTLNDGRRLTDEILQTVIVDAEDLINSRPLTVVTQEENFEEALTPNHFLRGVTVSDSRSLPTTDIKGAMRNEYLRSQQLSNELWARWLKEYVPSLNPRSKWHGDTKALAVGDLVYIVDGGNRRSWVRGVVEEPIVSKDGRVRQAWVRTNNGRFKRATTNLAVLEVQ